MTITLQDLITPEDATSGVATIQFGQLDDDPHVITVEYWGPSPDYDDPVLLAENDIEVNDADYDAACGETPCQKMASLLNWIHNTEFDRAVVHVTFD